MAVNRNAHENTNDRFALKDVLRVDSFEPVWVCCSRCSELAYMTPRWSDRRGECKCISCGAIYNLSLDQEYATRYLQLPLWLRANFRGHIFWAVNEEHLNHLARVIQAELRERPVIQQAKVRERFRTNQNMPFNLPAWILSAKNRPDLLRLIHRLRKTIPRSAKT
jgi:hypothetical protein